MLFIFLFLWFFFLFAVLWFGWRVWQPRRRVARRLRELGELKAGKAALAHEKAGGAERGEGNQRGMGRSEDKGKKEGETVGGERAKEISGWRRLWQTASRALGERQGADRLETALVRAGLEGDVGGFLLQNLLLAVGLPLLFLILTGPSVVLIFLFILGLIGPHLYLALRARARQRAFAAQLGDALGLMANALKAGYSFLQAMEMVAREMSPPLASEFARVFKEISLGEPTEEALANLGRRVANDDLELVLMAINIHRQVGGNLAEIFERVASTIRERMRIKGEIKTLTAQGRLSSLIISLLPPFLGVFMLIVNPGYMSLLLQHPLGKALLLAGGLSQILGMLLIRKIIAIEV